MTHKLFEFTYTVKQIDMQNCNILVTYTPTQSNLTSYTFNIAAFVPKEDGTMRTVEESIIGEAPHHMWGAQEVLLAEYDNVINTTRTVNPND